MDTNMEDVSIKQEPQAMMAPSDPPSIGTLDGWIETLMACKQLSEADVQRLCDKVCLCARLVEVFWLVFDSAVIKLTTKINNDRHVRYYRTNPTSSRL